MQKKLTYKKAKSKTNFFSRHLYLNMYLIGLGLSSIFVPFFAYAATTYSQDLFGLFEYAKDIIDDLVLWLFTTGAVIIFLFYLVRYLYDISRGKIDDSSIKRYILYGLIALTLMFTFYAVAGLIAVTFGIQLGIPQFFGQQSGLSPGSGTVQPYSIINR